MNSTLSYRIIFLLALLFTFTAQSQVVKIDKKELAFLADEEIVNVTFSFNNLLFNGDDITEVAFLSHIDEKIRRIQNDTIAETFSSLYEQSKKEDFLIAYVQELNKTTRDYKKAPKFILNNDDAKYTMNVNADWMYFGYNIGFVKQAAKLTTSITFFASESPDQIISKTVSSRATGVSYGDNFETEGGGIPCLKCMVNAYERSAYTLARALKRVLK